MKALLSLGILFLSSTFSVCAEDFTVPSLTGPIVDEVGLIDSGTRTSLENRFRELSNSGVAQVVILIPRSLQGLEVADYGIRVAEKWKIGLNRDRGVIFIVAPNERAMRIEVGYGLEGEIPDAIASRILEEIVKPEFKSGHFSDGILAGSEVLIKLARGDGSVAFPPRRKSARGNLGDTPLLGFILFCFILSRMRYYSGVPLAGALGFLFKIFGSSVIGLGAGIFLTGLFRTVFNSNNSFGNGLGGGSFGGGGFGGGTFGGGGFSSGGGGFSGGGGGFSGGGGSFGGGGSSSNW